jgi:hypothetical protein
MDRSTNESIRRGGWKVAIVLIAVAFVLFVLMMFSDSHQGSVSLKDEVNQKTFKNTERLLAVRANKVPEITGRVVRDGVVNTNNQGFEVKTKVGEIWFK